MNRAALVAGAAVNDCQSAPSNRTPVKEKHRSASSRLTRVAALAVVGFAWMLFWSPDAANAAAKSSTGTGNWNTAGTWSPSGVPANGDDVTIVSGHTVTVDVNTASLASLTVNGTLTVGNSGAARTVTVTGTVTVASGGSIAPGANNATHLMSIGGNLTNNGTFDGAPTGARVINVTFNGSANQTVSGTGATTRFNTITVNNTGAANNNIIDISSTNFTAAAGFLTLTRGILKVSGSFVFTNTFFSAAAYAINANSGIWLNNTNVTVSGQAGDPTLSGLLRITQGTYNVGTAADNDLKYATGSTIDIQGGALNITGALQGTTVTAAGSTNTTTYSQSGGTVTTEKINVSSDVTTGGKSFGSFDIHAAGSSFTMSAGTIVLQNPTNVQNDFVVGATLGSVTGGLIQFGNASTNINNPYAITCSTPMFNVTVKGTVSPFSELLNSPLTVKGALVIETGAVFNALSQALSVAGNWTNNGTFTPGTQTTTFNGAAAQTISGSTATTFSGLTLNNSAGLTLSTSASASGLLTLTSGDITTGANTLTQSSVGNGGLGSAAGPGDVVGTVSRTDCGTNARSFGNVDVRITTGNAAITSMTVKLVKSSPPDFMGAVNRTYTITQVSAGAPSATIRLRYVDTELHGNTESTLDLWKKSGTWSDQGVTTRDTTNNWDELTGVAGFSDWTIASPGAPTDVTMIYSRATRYDNRVLLEWQTGYEVNNIGFNIYREKNGNLEHVTPEPIAGSALFAGPRIALRAGFSYSWWDNQADGEDTSRYWIEDLDLTGRTTIHGPVGVDRAARDQEPPAGKPRVSLLSALGRDASDDGSTVVVEPLAKVAKVNRVRLAIQSGIASQQAVKLSVQREGWYRVEQSELLAAGFPASADPRKLQLIVDGGQVPIIVISGKPQPGLADGIEFYGIGIDSPSTTNHVYWLVAGSEDGLRIAKAPAPPKGGAPAPPTFPYTVERRDKIVYFPALKNQGGEKFFGPLIFNAQPVNQSLNLQHVATTSANATLEVSLQGFTDVPHSVRVVLNSTDLGTIQFGGLGKGVATYSVSQSALQEGTNQLQLIGPPGFSDISMVEYARLTYTHTNTADSNALRFPATGTVQSTIGGFTGPTIRVIDVTVTNRPLELETIVTRDSGGLYVATVTPLEKGARTLLAFASDQQKKPAAIVQNRPSNWRDPSNAADYVVITRKDFISSLEPLRVQRKSQGLSPAVVDIEDVYDEFSFGNKTPQALKDFLSYARSSWTKGPRFVVLAGDATYDPKNYLGAGDFDVVPTKLVETAFNETATDDWFADSNGDGVPDVAIGRLPVRTAQETAALVTKIVGYDRSAGTGRVLLLADTNEGSDFEGANDQLKQLIPIGLTVTDIRRGQVGDSTARTQLLNGINQGQSIVNYYGHGSTRVWASAPLLTAGDAASLVNQNGLSLFSAMTCLSGFFHDPSIESLGESLLKAQGGAIAVWASSGMTDPTAQVVMNQEAMRQLFGGSGITIGEATARAKAATANPDVRRTWILLGDPATKLR